MALRATSDPAPSTRSAKAGDRVEFAAKVENGSAGEATVLLAVEDLKEPFAFSFDPPSVAVPGKSRRRVAFAWTAALPEGREALTFRGRLVLRAMDGRLVGSAPLDLYVEARD
ncbi:MAG TPA: hypothetical protein VNX21_04010 [Candidatus Thermoplasmatota archaeon]|nr:hypothetical protein [Candidatus Thermoplasmatota archaeon]